MVAVMLLGLSSVLLGMFGASE